MTKVINLPCITRLDLTANRVLQSAIEADLEGVVLMGYTKDGEHYFCSSYADGGTCLWLIEKLKQEIMDVNCA
jgi:hypothetical protein